MRRWERVSGVSGGRGSRSWRLLAIGGLLLAAGVRAGPATAVSIGESTDKLGSMELPSGMRIVIEEDHSKPVVVVVTVLSAGAAEDPVGKEGLAHLVEHLTSRARPDGKTQRASQLDFAGASSWNGSTTHDLTTYAAVGPKEALRNLLVIEGGRLAGPLAGLDPRVFELERDVVMAELTGRDEQGEPSAVQTRLYDMLYPEGHRYFRPVMGTPRSLADISLADAQAFVAKNYVPSNVTLYVAGDVDLSTIHQVFGATLPKTFVEAPATGPVSPPVRLAKEAPSLPPVPPAQPIATIRAPVEGPMLYLTWSLPRGYSPEGTLERAVRSAIEAVPVWASRASDIKDVRATLVAGRDASTLVCAVALKEGRNPEKSLEHVLDQFHRFSDPSAPTGPNANEVGRLDNSMSDSSLGVGGTNITGGGGGRTLAPQATGMSGLSGGDTGFSTSSLSRPAAVVTADVHVARLENTAVVDDVLETESVLARARDRATMAHWTGDPSAWTKDMTALTEVGPSKWQAFTLQWLNRDRARALLVEPNGESLEAPESGAPPKVFAADDVHVKISSGALKTYAHGPLDDIRTVTLKNGLHVLLVRRVGAPTVAATVGVRGGTATAEPLGAAELATRLAVPLEVGNGPPSQFGGSVTLTTGPDATYVEGRAASGNLADLLTVLSDTTQSLHVDDSFSRKWNEIVDDRHRFDGTPNAEADRRFLADVYPGSSAGRVAQADDFKKLGTGQLNRWMDGSFRPDNAVLAVVGDINVAEAEQQVHQWFDGWRGARDARAQAPRGGLKERKGPVRVLTVDRPGAERTEIRIGCGIQPNGAAHTGTDLLALKLLGSRLRTKLGTLARSTLGGSDGFAGGASLQLTAARLDVAGTVDGRALNPVLAAARSELVALDDLKVTEDELALLKWREAMGWNGRYATNAELAQALVWSQLAELPLDMLQKYADQLATLTPEDLTRVATACRKTAVLMLSGDPAVVDKALFVTDGMMLRQGHN